MTTFPDGIFARSDEAPEGDFVASDRFHPDDGAIAAVGERDAGAP